MNYLSVCSGIEAASMAWEPLGWNAVGFSEIEKFPSEVLAHRWPDVPNLGDMTKYREWNIRKSIDLLVGGTPCQAFSVAGLRKGLDDPRGNLTLTFLAMADHFKPSWVVWENVPGVLSDKGNAFGQFLSGLGELGYQYAYRVLDAQHFGVPQRRRRVFVVANLGGVHPAQVLFEPESLCGNITPSRETGESIATGVAGSLGSRGVRSHTELDGHGAYIPSVANPLPARMHKGINTTCDEGRTPIVIARTLRDEGFNASKDGTGRGTTIVPIGVDEEQNASIDLMGTLKAREKGGGFEGAVAFHESRPANLAGVGMAVRRLTPTECERLQGFPDGHTMIPRKGKPAEECADGPRYKALGNSMAVPVMRWIGQRIEATRPSPAITADTNNEQINAK